MYREKRERELTQARACDLCLTIASFKHNPPTHNRAPIWSGIERVYAHEGTDNDLLDLNVAQARDGTVSPASLYLKGRSDPDTSRYDITLRTLCILIVVYQSDALAENSHARPTSLGTDSSDMEACERKNSLMTEPDTLIDQSLCIHEVIKVHTISPIKIDPIQFLPENTFSCNNNAVTRNRSKACLFLIQTSHSDDYIGTNAQIIVYSLFQHIIQGWQIIRGSS